MNVKLHSMQSAVERQQSTENMYISQVNHIAEELKRIDFLIESEKLENAKAIKNAGDTIIQFNEKVTQSANIIKENEAKNKVSDEKINVLKNEIESIKQSLRDTDRHINAFLPVETFNILTETLHASLDGAQFNKLIKFEKLKYLQLEKEIIQKDAKNLVKLHYEIPPIPEMVEEV